MNPNPPVTKTRVLRFCSDIVPKLANSFFQSLARFPAGVASFLDREDRIGKIERGPFFAGDDRLLPGNPLQNFEELIDRGSHAGAQIIYAGEVVRYHLGKECTDVVDM